MARQHTHLWDRLKSFWRRRVVPVGGFLILLCIVVPHALGSRDGHSGGAGKPTADDGGTFERGDVFSATVTYIVDGDGIRLDNGLEVRLGDFDAPEWNEPGGKQAKRALSNLTLGRQVKCTACEGARNSNRCWSYDRIIAVCRLKGARLGDRMRAQGVREGGR
jgi:endonuclease YncB( thermonuclease family)